MFTRGSLLEMWENIEFVQDKQLSTKYRREAS